MTKSIEKFLEFNGKTIYFLAVDGIYWIAVKPICEAIGINYDRQFKNLKSSKLYRQLYAKQHMVGADNRLREMIALPERYIYAWIFQLNSDSEELITYQLKCCDVLYDYFHGTITQRAKLLIQHQADSIRIGEIEKQLSDNSLFSELQSLKKNRRARVNSLLELDLNLVTGQLKIFDDEQTEGVPNQSDLREKIIKQAKLKK
jgi:hypothetical protein